MKKINNLNYRIENVDFIIFQKITPAALLFSAYI